MAPIGEVSTIVGTVDSVANRPTSKRGMIVTEVFLVDASGVLKIAFFKQPWIAREFAVGIVWRLSAKSSSPMDSSR